MKIFDIILSSFKWKKDLIFEWIFNGRFVYWLITAVLYTAEGVSITSPPTILKHLLLSSTIPELVAGARLLISLRKHTAGPSPACRA